MATKQLLAITLVAVQVVFTHASFESIAGYNPGSKVTDHNAIDLDQKAIEIVLGLDPIDYTKVENIYKDGGNSKSYAEFTVPASALSRPVTKGEQVVGVGGGSGKMYANYASGDTTIKVAYATNDVQASYVNCKVGALDPAPGGSFGVLEPYQLTTGCFIGDLTIGSGATAITMTPTVGPTNKAGRTLRGFSTKAGGLMYTKDVGCQNASNRATDGCPYRDFSMYYNYYGSFDYADKFVMAAITGGPTDFGTSSRNMDFTNTDNTLRKECIKKGTAYMNAYMYAIREFEDAIDDCKAGCIGGVFGTGADCNSLSTASVHAWDEGVAFYTGSREGAAAGGDSAGVLSYRLAEKRCANFKTCGENHDSTTGTSFVNIELFRQFAIGAQHLLLGKCEVETRPVVRKVVALMAIPLIQGTLRYAHKIDKQSDATPKSRGEGAVFAAAIVPRVAFCNAADGDTIMNNMKVGATSTSFAAVKAAFENNYACMEITCAQVGGLWKNTESRYYDGAQPCDTASSMQTWESIAGYVPGSQVTDHNAIDLDQAAIEYALSQTTINYNMVKDIYENGGNSKSYAEFTVPALNSALSKGATVVGATSLARGKIYANAATNDLIVKVAYATSSTQSTYVSCKEGSLQAAPAGTTAAATEAFKFTAGCFQAGESLILSTSTGSTIVPTTSVVNLAGRTLKGFSTKAGGLMYEKGSAGCKDASNRATDGCPYRDFKMYYDYYGSFDYGNVFVLAAINGGPTTFGTSSHNMDFTNTDDTLRKECIKKGTAYMNAYMYAIREFEDAIDDCKAGCTGGIFGSGASCNSLSTASVHAWDEGVAFYTGSREGAAAGGNSNGVLSYRLAEKRCANFKTCGPNHDSTTGTSFVNLELFRQFTIGANFLLRGQCEVETRPVVRKVVALMAIPLIQGTLRYAHKIDKLNDATPKSRGEGAVFAAAIVPRVAFCNAADGETIMNNMKVGATSTSLAAVKSAFENNYACMEITCAQVGGLWFDAESKYYDGAAPCSEATPVASSSEDKEKLPTWAIIVIIAVGVAALIFLVVSIICMSRAKKYQSLAAQGQGKNGASGQAIGAV